MQPAIFAPRQRAFDDEAGDKRQIAQLQKIGADAKAAIKIVDLFLDDLQAAARAQQALVAAHNADIIPHQAARFFPIVGDGDGFGRSPHKAVVPRRRRGRRRGRVLVNRRRRRPRRRHAFQKRVARQPIRAVQPGASGLAGDEQIAQIRARVAVGHDAAAKIMRRRHDRNRPLGDVDSQPRAFFANGRESLAQKRFVARGQIEIHAIGAAFFHLGVDRARHDVARREFGVGMIGRQKARPSPSTILPPSPRAASLIKKEPACG